MFVSVSNELPKTSYMKMVDYWLVFNLFIPFVEVLLHVYMVREILWWCFVRFLKGNNCIKKNQVNDFLSVLYLKNIEGYLDVASVVAFFLLKWV